MAILKTVESRIEVDIYLKEISTHLGIDKQTLYEEYRAFRVNRKPKVEEVQKVE
jgi:hypothetical protein